MTLAHEEECSKDPLFLEPSVWDGGIGNLMDIPVLRMDVAGKIISINKKAEILLGYKEGELKGKQSPLIFHDMEELLVMAEFLSNKLDRVVTPDFSVLVEEVRQKKAPVGYDWTYILKNKERESVTLYISPLLGKKREIEGYLFFPMAKGRKESVLKKDPLKVVENLSVVVFLRPLDGLQPPVILNDRIKDLTGFSREAFFLQEVNFHSLLFDEDRIRVERVIADAGLRDKTYQVMYRLLKKDGSLIWVEERGSFVKGGGGEPLISGIVVDIHERKLSEDLILKIALENENIFQETGEVHAVLDPWGKLKRVNGPFCEFVGLEEDQLIGRDWSDFLSADWRKAKEVFDQLESKEKVQWEIKWLDAKGKKRWFIVSLVKNRDRSVIFLSGHDISDLKIKEEILKVGQSNLEFLVGDLREQNRKLEDFAHIITHNLRSPISNIQSLISLLDSSSSREEFQLIFEKLKKVSSHVEETMGDLMEVIQVDNQDGVEREKCDFEDIWNKVVRSLEGEVLATGGVLVHNFSEVSTHWYSKTYLESIFQIILHWSSVNRHKSSYWPTLQKSPLLCFFQPQIFLQEFS